MRQTTTARVRYDEVKAPSFMHHEAGIHGNPSIPLPALPIAVRAFCHGPQKTRHWRSPVPQSEQKNFLSMNYLTLLDQFLNDAG
jgi:hypothetical protein